MIFSIQWKHIYSSQINCHEALEPTAMVHSNRLPWDTHTECQNGRNTVRGECALAVGSSVGLQSDQLFRNSRINCLQAVGLTADSVHSVIPALVIPPLGMGSLCSATLPSKSTSRRVSCPPSRIDRHTSQPRPWEGLLLKSLQIRAPHQYAHTRSSTPPVSLRRCAHVPSRLPHEGRVPPPARRTGLDGPRARAQDQGQGRG
jgi:hypothetical protein